MNLNVKVGVTEFLQVLFQIILERVLAVLGSSARGREQ